MLKVVERFTLSQVREIFGISKHFPDRTYKMSKEEREEALKILLTLLLGGCLDREAEESVYYFLLSLGRKNLFRIFNLDEKSQELSQSWRLFTGSTFRYLLSREGFSKAVMLTSMKSPYSKTRYLTIRGKMPIRCFIQVKYLVSSSYIYLYRGPQKLLSTIYTRLKVEQNLIFPHIHLIEIPSMENLYEQVLPYPYLVQGGFLLRKCLTTRKKRAIERYLLSTYRELMPQEYLNNDREHYFESILKECCN